MEELYYSSMAGTEKKFVSEFEWIRELMIISATFFVVSTKILSL